ncbi:hypothetical protein JW949_02390 [Candidatus Woesearchaeota archaeon]|nr:hypothetical protein [Candidatus Woesearchaeota archaeon]
MIKNNIKNKKALTVSKLITIIAIVVVLLIVMGFMIKSRGAIIDGIDSFFANMFKPH